MPSVSAGHGKASAVGRVHMRDRHVTKSRGPRQVGHGKASQWGGAHVRDRHVTKSRGPRQVPQDGGR
jgi:hypothetical protein